MNTCPDCKCDFVQPFVCVTCGAQKLYDHTVTSQADTIEALRARVAALERAADNVIRCNTFGCAFPHPSFCPAQCQADQALRATLNGTADPEGAQRNGD